MNDPLSAHTTQMERLGWKGESMLEKGWIHPDLEDFFSSEMNRRDFLKSAGKVAMFALGFTLFNPLPDIPLQAAPRFSLYPFTLGVASGDPLPDSVVLWTRLTTDPLNGGGYPPYNIPVKWEIAEDERFQRVVQTGTTVARPELGHSVHVDVNGLKPGHEYWYRFKSGSEISPVGRTKTAPSPQSRLTDFTFAFASCQQFEHGYYTAYRHMAREDLDLVVHLGDYIYEYGPHRYIASGGNIRKHHGRETKTLADYRNRYAQYRSDEDLKAAHANFPWLVVWDDHEVQNNYAAQMPERGRGGKDFLRRRAAAYQAYYEHMPLRRSSLPIGPDMRLYRRFTFGDLVEFNLLDTRQYRDNQVSNAKWSPPGMRSTAQNRSILGQKQEQWLMEGLKHSRARWNLLAQQVFFSQRIWREGNQRLLNMDTWDGYAASRHRLLQFLAQEKISNPVVITGDVHSNWACDLKTDFGDHRSETVGVEFVGTSITSGGDGSDTLRSARRMLRDNPHIRFFNNRRGYVRCRLTRNYCLTDYRVVPYVSRPHAPIATRASFAVEHGKPGIQTAGTFDR